MTARPRIALIHATPVAVEPIAAAFAMLWPEAEPVNILDNSLSVDRAKSAALTAALEVRIGDLAVYGRSIGADAILFTCSAFGAAIERAGKTLDVPVLKPNEAMFEEALAFGDRIGMIATFAPAVATMEAEFVEDARRFRPTARLATCLAADAMSALRSGDAETHNRTRRRALRCPNGRRRRHASSFLDRTRPRGLACNCVLARVVVSGSRSSQAPPAALFPMIRVLLQLRKMLR